MIEWLEGIDRELLLAINGAHHPILDEIMWIISAKFTWIPLYVFLVYLAYQQFGRNGMLLFLGCILVCVALADLSSVHLFKNIFQRYRPTHNLDLSHQLHVYQYANGEFYRGGMYGFVSSHAANFAAVITFSLVILKRSWWLVSSLLLIHVLVCYSRIYLGVHYPSDVAVGSLVGVLATLIPVYAFRKLSVKF